MQKNLAIALILGLCASARPEVAAAFECNVCHSKNPAMVKMHKATQSKEIGCFDCHRIGEKLMGKGRPKDLASLLQRRIIEQICTECHRK
jgi:hypothetical protein